jgi:hypothetical protein
MSDPKISILPDMPPSVWGKSSRNQWLNSRSMNTSRGPDLVEDSDGDKPTLLSRITFRYFEFIVAPMW